eukprot:COSAG01_NODE_1233_length_11110_cov_13.006902_3_plen_39_part_00
MSRLFLTPKLRMETPGHAQAADIDMFGVSLPWHIVHTY